ncbi:phytanoyl-CoA dioxygenase family protein [Oleiharenicola lentus]|uniref:phytanoyl-CoA dioxygenase family protein n=1 Tax=Oleiharenicola lentus TaxID=2508720 RepID=UPI003F661989
MPTHLEEYLFDLQGFFVVRNALSASEVAACNAAIDEIPRSLPRLGWHGHVQREDHPEHRGISYQQVYELPAFAKLIDHPGYINYVARFSGGQDTFDYHHAPLYIDENFFNIRGAGEAIPLHAGGHDICRRMQFRYHNGRFACGQINVLIAHTDIGPGDGATMVIPGSHKSNIIHPAFLRENKSAEWDKGGSVEGTPGAVEVHLQAGDAIVFVDATCHGSAKRVNPGERRISVYRYGPSWGNSRWGYRASADLVSRLNPLAAKIAEPQDYRIAPGTTPRN